MTDGSAICVGLPVNEQASEVAWQAAASHYILDMFAMVFEDQLAL